MAETLSQPGAVAASAKLTDRLRITEIFYSLQGEADTVGWPTVFIRLTGCPLRCHYCDTTYAYEGGERLSVADIMAATQAYGARYVTVTGGEPLAQKACPALLRQLCDAGYRVSLETSGALDVSAVDARVIKVMDLKTPSSGECERNRYENLDDLNPHDQLKMVICDRSDYEWARQQIERRRLTAICDVLLSPGHALLSPGELADWVLADRLAVRVQVQLHKYLWGDVPGR
jgi:7-carboxy-7-deazaguanine synthase